MTLQLLLARGVRDERSSARGPRRQAFVAAAAGRPHDRPRLSAGRQSQVASESVDASAPYTARASGAPAPSSRSTCSPSRHSEGARLVGVKGMCHSDAPDDTMAIRPFARAATTTAWVRRGALARAVRSRLGRHLSFTAVCVCASACCRASHHHPLPLLLSTLVAAVPPRHRQAAGVAASRVASATAACSATRCALQRRPARRPPTRAAASRKRRSCARCAPPTSC